MKRPIEAMVVLLVLGGCTLGPDYHLPDDAKINDPAAQGAFLGAATPGLTADRVPDDWWHLFDDRRLDALEQEALAANTDLRVAAANLERASAVLVEAEDLQGVHGGASYEADRARLSGESYLLPAQLPVQNYGTGDIRISYQLDLFGRLKRAAEAARDDKEASQAGLELARITIAADVAGAYVEACAAGRELVVVQQEVSLQAESQEVTHRLTDAGRLSTLAFTQASGRLDQLRADLPALQARRRVSLYRLAALTGHPPADYPKDLESCERLPRIFHPLPVGDGAALLRRRPDIRQAERSLAAATARIGVATASLYPDVTLGADVGTIGLLGDFANPASLTWGLGSLISWTFPTEGETARVKEASASADAALARFDGVVLNALRETETSLTLYRQDLERTADLRAARDRAADAAQQTGALVGNGRSPYLDGLAAKQSLTAAEVTLAQAEAKVSADQVTLFLALGGGWAQG